jgi:hypothetical protein
MGRIVAHENGCRGVEAAMVQHRSVEGEGPTEIADVRIGPAGPGTLDAVIGLARTWFADHLARQGHHAAHGRIEIDPHRRGAGRH